MSNSMSQKIRFAVILWMASISMALPSCQGQGIKDTGPAFYYWKTSIDFTLEAAELADQMGNQHFYLRYFDVDWSAGYESAIPRGVLALEYYQNLNGWDKRTLTPAVYITNRTFERIKESDLPALADKVARKVSQITEDLSHGVYGVYYLNRMPPQLTWEERNDILDSMKIQWRNKVVELQIDCDWTQTTRDKYFSFLKLLKQTAVGTTITSTLRLHQYRDRKIMGIPPVDKVMLMCYNTGDPKKQAETNAILDAQVVKQYLKGRKYPLEMELALPIFNWGAWYRAGAFQGLLRNFSAEQPGAETFLKHEQNNQYRILQDTVLGQDYLREGDLIRMDGPTPAQMNETLKVLKERIGHRFSRVAFFDWDYEKIKLNQTAISTYFETLKKD